MTWHVYPAFTIGLILGCGCGLIIAALLGMARRCSENDQRNSSPGPQVYPPRGEGK